MPDKFLTLFGTVFGGRPLAYGRIDRARLPDHVNSLLGYYKSILLLLCGAFVAPLAYLDLMAVIMFVPLLAFAFILKQRFEKQLDPLLEAYIPKDDMP